MTPPAKAPLWFDFWATAKGEPLKALVRDAQGIIESREERSRKRRPEDQRTFERCVEAIVVNLVVSALTTVLARVCEGELAAIGVPLKKDHADWRPGRYSHHGLKQETFRKLLDAMDGEFLTLNCSGWRGVSSSIVPSPEFAATVESYGVLASDVGSLEEGETIWLTLKHGKGERELIDYEDSSQTHAMREELDALNHWLGDASIELAPNGLSPPVLVSRRRLSRRFILPNADHPRDFAYGGRLYGGFWEQLPRDARRERLRINGERIAEADCSSMFLRLASALGGEEINTPDPYSALTGLSDCCSRGVIKSAVSSLLFKPSLKRWPKEIAEQLPESVTPRVFRQALLQAFPSLGHCFECQSNEVAIGFRLFRLESDILLRALGLLRVDGVVALPLHDAVLIPESAADLARERLEQAAMEVAGVRIPVKVLRAEVEARDVVVVPDKLHHSSSEKRLRVI